MKRKLLSIVLCVAMAATLLTGCGGTTNEEASEPAAEEAVTEEATEEAETEETQRFEETVTLTYLTWDYADRTPSTDAWIDGCLEKFNIEIDLQNVPSADYQATFKTKLAAEDMPDLFKVHNITQPNYVAETIETSRDLYVDISDLENVAKYSEDALDLVKIDGELFYVPVSWSACGVIYNKAVFEANSVEIPTNINELVAAMDTFKANGVAPLAGSYGELWTTQIIPLIGFDNYVGKDGYAKELYNGLEKTSSAKWSETEGLAEAIDLAKTWIDAGYFTEDPIATDATTACQMVGTGDAAMYITGNWQASLAMAAAEDPTDIGFFALPLNEEGEELFIPATSSEGICINGQGEKVEAAKIALNYYLSKEIQELVMVDFGGVSTHADIVSEDPFVAELKAAIDNNSVMGCGIYTRGSHGWPAASGYNILVDFQRVLMGEIEGLDICNALDEVIAKEVGE